MKNKKEGIFQNSLIGSVYGTLILVALSWLALEKSLNAKDRAPALLEPKTGVSSFGKQKDWSPSGVSIPLG